MSTLTLKEMRKRVLNLISAQGRKIRKQGLTAENKRVLSEFSSLSEKIKAIFALEQETKKRQLFGKTNPQRGSLKRAAERELYENLIPIGKDNPHADE
jgi:hypothetical protein